MPVSITRRGFLQRASLLVLAPSVRLRNVSAPDRLRVGVLGVSSAAHSGAVLGVEEANHAGALFGGGADLVLVTESSLPNSHLSAVLGVADAGATLRLSRLAAANDILHMNVACTADSLRGTDCAARTFHVAPSEAMLRDAARLADRAGADIATWDASLTRFGADTLNQRYRARFGQPMTGDAWCAWVAVKVLWESSLRARSTRAAALRDYLARDTTQFDGHKGRPLSFRTWDHQLRQPLYAVVPGGAVVELPSVGAADASTRDVLDQLGARQADSACRMTP